MFNGKKVIVIMPAYNAETTLKRTYDEVMAQNIVDLVIVVQNVMTSFLCSLIVIFVEKSLKLLRISWITSSVLC